MTWILGQSGGNATNYIQFIIFALMISISAIGWIIKLVAQKREEARIRMAKRRREEELLRTGRTPEGSVMPQAAAPVAGAPASHEDARRRLQEIAQRRRAELEQMARGGDAGSRPAPVPVPSPQAQRTTAPTSRPFQPKPMTQPGGPASPSPRQGAGPARQKPVQRPEQRKKPKPQQQQPQRTTTLADKLMERPAAAASSGAYAVAPQAHPTTGSPASAGPVVAQRGPRFTMDRATSPAGLEALRKALVLAEVLAPPVSMRAEGDGTENAFLRRAG